MGRQREDRERTEGVGRRSLRHVLADDYARTESGRQSGGALARLLHSHAIESLRPWQREWELLGVAQQNQINRLLASLRWNDEASQHDRAKPDEAYLPAISTDAQRLEEEVTAARKELRNIRRRFRAFLQTPPDRWEEKIERANHRFRSRWMAELFLAECETRIHDAPREVEQLASLVPKVLQRIPGSEGQPWRNALAARAAAYEANALRVAGDLPEADRRFVTLRSELSRRPVRDLSTLADVANLEASLRIDQRRTAEADHLLDRAVLLYRQSENVEGEGRALLKQANLLQTAGRPQAMLAKLESAIHILATVDKLNLSLSAIAAHVNALCDLGQPKEADDQLRSHEERFEASEDLYMAAMLRALKGRVALGLGDHEAAANLLCDCCEVFLDLGRSYDAALAGLHVAEVYLESGRVREIGDLAGKLVRAFRAQQVEREAMAALHLLARAAADQQVTSTLLAQLRSRLRETSSRQGR